MNCSIFKACLLTVATLFLHLNTTYAQEQATCICGGTHDSEFYTIQELIAMSSQHKKSTNADGIRYVPMSFYMARNDDGSPGSAGYDNFEDFFVTYIYMNKMLNEIGVQIYAASTPTHLDETRFIYPARNSQDWIDFRTNKNANTPNTWINQGWSNNSGAGFAGNSTVELGSSSFTLIIHELGHFFGLTHTFSTKGEGAELVNRDLTLGNADRAGDFLIDTEADPYEISGYTYASGAMTSDTRDANGELYTPPFDNIMAYYWGKKGFIFTPEQYELMDLTATARYNDVLEYLDPSAPVAGAPTNVTSTSVYDGYQIAWTNGANGLATQIELSDDGGTTWNVEAGTTTDNESYTIHDLDQDKTYLLRIKHFNSVDAYSTPISITPDKINYELPYYIADFTGGSGSGGIGIGLMQILGTSFRNADNILDPYRLYQETDVGVAELEQGIEYTFSTDVRVRNGVIYGGDLVVWIDYNADGDFDDTGELIYRLPDNKRDFEFLNFTVTIPSNATPGKTRMRARAMPYVVEDPYSFIANSEIEDYVVTIVGDPVGFSITYNLNEGTNAIANPETYATEDATIILADATRDGYLFDGWFSDELGTTQVTSIETGSSENITLYAKWSAEDFDITYHLNGGNNIGSNPSAYTISDETITLTDPTRTDYRFNGWYSEAEFTNSISTIPTGSFGDVELFAKWLAEDHTITYVLDEGINAADNPEVFTIEDQTIQLKDPIKTHYTFEGWFTDEAFTDEVFQIETDGLIDFTLYAQWKVIEYNISYQLEGDASNDANNPMSGTIETANIGLNDPVRAHYTFMGWYLESSFTNQITEIDALTENLILYPKWEAVVYTISYNVDDGMTHTNPTSWTISDEDVTLSDPQRSGFIFLGWFTDQAFSHGVMILNGDNVNETFYAKWDPEAVISPFTICYILDPDIENSNPPEWIATDGSVTLLPIEKDGYSFAGWYTEEALTNSITVLEDITENLILYPKLELLEYLVDYELGGGENNQNNPDTYTIEEMTFMFEAPTKSGYQFDGWYSDEAYSNSITQVAFGSTGDIAIYAQWSPIEYSVAYVLDGGTNSTLNPHTFTVEDSNIQLIDPDKAGYTFNGWYSDPSFSNQITELETSLITDQTVYAQWMATDYVITYDTGGGINSDLNPTSYSIIDDNFDLYEATRIGYDFDGWFLEPDYTTRVTLIETEAIEEIKLYAKWVTQSFMIYYTLDGGENSLMNPISYTVEDENIELIDASRENYRFAGWYSDANMTDQIVEIATDKGTDIMIYAQWEAVSYSITYVLNNGQNSMDNPNDYTVEDGDVRFLAATRDGYAFEGWYSDDEMTEPFERFNTALAENLNIYAKWFANTYQVSYDLFGGENHSTNPSSFVFGSGNILLLTPSRSGYSFKGWYKDEALTDKALLVNTLNPEDQHFYAKWSSINYAVNYTLNGGVNAVDNPTEFTAGDENITLIAPSRENYTFEGWFSDEALTMQVSEIEPSFAQDIMLYAKWKEIEYTITYNLNGSENNSKNPERYTIADENIDLESPTRLGYNFVTWYKDAALTQAITTIETNSAIDYIVYAKWEIDIFSIEYELNNGENNTLNPTSYTVEDDMILLMDPNREGYTFEGWYRDEAMTLAVSNIETNSVTDYLLYAKWSATIYTITYHMNDGVNNSANPISYTVEDEIVDLLDPTKDAYIFDGWYRDEALTTPFIIDDVSELEDIDIYANWTLDVSSKESTLKKGLKIYPQPINSGEDFNVDLEGFHTSVLKHSTLQIINLSGAIVQQTDAPSEHELLHIEHSGIYMIILKTDGENFIEKVIVTKK